MFKLLSVAIITSLFTLVPAASAHASIGCGDRWPSTCDPVPPVVTCVKRCYNPYVLPVR